MSTLTVATWNVNGIRARGEQFLEWIVQERPDIVCLQEIKATPEQLPAEVAVLPGYNSYWHGSAGGYSGVALLIRDGVFSREPVHSHPPFDMESRLVQATIGELVIASVYIPNGGKDYDAKLKFMAEMEEYAAGIQATGSTLILCGDMNVARTDRDIHPGQNKPGIIGTRADERELFERMIAHDLIDVGRTLHPDDDRLFTWWPYWKGARERNLGWRIDYIFVGQRLAPTLQRCDVRRQTGSSDHAPVVAVFDLSMSDLNL